MTRPPAGIASLPPLAPARAFGRRDGPKLSRATLKRQHIELCFFGAIGIEVARDAYWESLGADEPRLGNTPTFGEYPEQTRNRRNGEPSLAERMGQLPFSRHVHACTSAKSRKKPGWAAIDAAVGAFEAYVGPLHRDLSDASRYYARSDFARDGFKRGSELHRSLSDELAKFDDAHAALGRSFVKWQRQLDAPKEAADRGAKLGHHAVVAAGVLALALLPTPRDREGIEAALATTRKTAAALAAFGKAQREAPHPRQLAPKLDELLSAAAQTMSLAPTRKLTPTERYRVASAATAVIEADRRALLRQLRGDDTDSLGIPGLGERMRRAAGRSSPSTKARPRPPGPAIKQR